MSSLLVEAVPAAAVQVAVPVQNPEPPPGQGPEFGKASPIALVIIIVLGVVTAVLIRSMSKRIRRLPESFEAADDQDHGDREKEEEPGSDAADAGNGRA